MRFSPYRKKKHLIIVTCGLVLVALSIGGGLFALKKYRTKNWEQARAAYKTADYGSVIQLVGNLPRPTTSEDQQMLGHAYMATGDYGNALPLFEELSENPSNPDAKLMVGNILRSQNKEREAEETYLEVISKNPNYIQAYLNLASVYRTGGQQDLANGILEEGIKYNPSSLSLVEYWLETNSDKKDTEEYKAWYQKALQISPNFQLDPGVSPKQ